jgi:hypothetical protein
VVRKIDNEMHPLLDSSSYYDFFKNVIRQELRGAREEKLAQRIVNQSITWTMTDI